MVLGTSTSTGRNMSAASPANMQDYEATYRDATMEVPEFYNYGFDVVDRWAEDRTKLALISVDPSGKIFVADHVNDRIQVFK